MITKHKTDITLACSTFFASKQASKQASTLAGHKQASYSYLTRLFFNPFILVFILSLSLSMCDGGGGGASPSCDIDALEIDCDGDGYTNEEEKICGSDPNDPTSTISGKAIDCDGDDANNEDELACGTDPNDPASKSGNATDCDDDGVLNADDVDKDNDGLIEILSLEMLYNIRYDLDGTHYDTDADDSTGKEGSNAGCLNNACQGYELVQDLNFDENNNGLADDPYTMGLAWEPIAASTQKVNLEFECVNSNALSYDSTVWNFSGSTSALNCDGNVILLFHGSTAALSCGLATATPLEWPASGTMNYKSKLTIPLNSMVFSNDIIGLILTCANNPHTISWDDIPDHALSGPTFDAIFEGNGYTIANLRIHRPSLGYLGLFGQLGSSGVVRNLKLEQKLEIVGLAYVASVVGNNQGTVENITLDIVNNADSDICATSTRPNITLASQVVASGNPATNVTLVNAPKLESTSFQADGTTVDTASTCP